MNHAISNNKIIPQSLDISMPLLDVPSFSSNQISTPTKTANVYSSMFLLDHNIVYYSCYLNLYIGFICWIVYLMKYSYFELKRLIYISIVFYRIWHNSRYLEKDWNQADTKNHPKFKKEDWPTRACHYGLRIHVSGDESPMTATCSKKKSTSKK